MARVGVCGLPLIVRVGVEALAHVVAELWDEGAHELRAAVREQSVAAVGLDDRMPLRAHGGAACACGTQHALARSWRSLHLACAKKVCNTNDQ